MDFRKPSPFVGSGYAEASELFFCRSRSRQTITLTRTEQNQLHFCPLVAKCGRFLSHCSPGYMLPDPTTLADAQPHPVQQTIYGGWWWHGVGGRMTLGEESQMACDTVNSYLVIWASSPHRCMCTHTPCPRAYCLTEHIEDD